MKNRKLTVRLVFLAILLTATFGAGLADMLTDVIPIRPYTGVFHYTPIETLGRQSVMSEVLIVTLVVTLIATLLVAVANRTTGIVIAHSGFTPNGNLTGTPGLASIMQLYPLFFALFGVVIVAFRWMRKDEAGV